MALSMEADILTFTKILPPKAAGIAVSHAYVMVKMKLDCPVVPTC